MEYKEDVLKGLPLSSLRDIGIKVGVRSSTTLTKDKLVDNILDVLEGRELPYFSNRGRRPIKRQELNKDLLSLLSNFHTKKSIDSLFEKAVDEFLAKLKNQIMSLYLKK